MPPVSRRATALVATAALAALGGGTLAACTMAADGPGPTLPAPSVTAPATPTTPRAYAERALDLLGESLEVGPGYDVLRGIALRKAAPATTTAGTYDALRNVLVGIGQSPGDLITLDAASRVPASPGRPSAATSDGVTVVTLPGFADLRARPGSGAVTPAETAYARDGSSAVANAARATTCGWVVDVRGNGSTDVPVLLGSVAALLPAGPALTRVDRDGRHSDLLLTDDAVVAGAGAGAGAGPGAGTDATGATTVLPLDPVARHDDQPVVVLQDSGTTRAGEAVVLAFRARPDSHAVGSATFGAATDGTTTPLSDGTLLYVARWRLGVPGGAVATGPVLPQESSADELAVDVARVAAEPLRQLSVVADLLPR